MSSSKPKSRSTGDAKKRLKKLLAKVREGDRSAEETIAGELGALLDADATAIAEVDALRMLPISAEKDMLAVFDLLLTRGADPRVRVEDDWIPGLASLMSSGRAEDDARVIALAERMIARGADPNERSEREGVLDRAAGSLARVEALLRLGADEASALAALHVAVPRVAREPAIGAIVQRLLAHIPDIDRPGDDGLSALHIVALRGAPALLGSTLARSRQPGHPVASVGVFHCDGCSPPGGGMVPMLQLPPGFTALDLATEAHAMYAAAVAWYGDDGFDARRRRERRDELAANAALLAARGVAHGAPDRGELPGFVADVDALLGRLADHVGGDRAALQRRAAAIVCEGVGPWTYASTLLERSASILLRGAAEAHLADSWLAHLISGEHRRFVAARHKPLGGRSPDLSIYPPEAQRPLKTGVIVGGRGDALLLVWPHAEGVARLGVASPGDFVLLGDDFFAFLRGQLRGLGVAIDDLGTGAAAGPGGGHTRLLKADYEHPPGPADINRVGGRPIGFDAASWPRREGAPMHHVLTIDLREHPTFGPPGVRALALFISSPDQHEAYAARNDHTRVVLLSDADLQRGEPPWPPELAGTDTLAPGALRFESAATLTREEIYRHSFAGAFPIWLQGDESEDYGGGDDDYDDEGSDEYDDGDGDGDDVPRPDPPRHFVLQFDESLIPGINLGDLGIMYVFAETAWFQCH